MSKHHEKHTSKQISKQISKPSTQADKQAGEHLIEVQMGRLKYHLLEASLAKRHLHRHLNRHRHLKRPRMPVGQWRVR